MIVKLSMKHFYITMKSIKNIYILIFITLVFSEIQIPPYDLNNWNVLNKTMPWVGYQNYDEFPWCRATNVFPYSIKEIESFIGKFDTYSTTFSRMIASDLIDTNIVYLRVDYPLFLSDRDYIVEYHSFTKDQNLFYQWTAIEHEDVPIYDNAVRLVNAAGEWALIFISPDSTEVSYSWNGELLGDFPRFSLTTAWETGGTEIINELRHAIEAHYK